MLVFWQSHAEYQQFVTERWLELYTNHAGNLEYHDALISKLWYLDLDPVLELLAPYYGQSGRPAVNQPQILRALVAMSHCGYDSVTSWVKVLRSDPVLVMACGFEDGHIPGIGTFYDFLDRLWLEEPKQKRPRAKNRKPGKPQKKGEKLKPRHDGIVAQIVDKAMEGRTAHHCPQSLFQKLFTQVAVLTSAQLGLLGDTNNLTISGDGTPVESGSSPYGKPTCTCRKQRIFSCDCKRIYSDPDARWGWDSYREVFFYGYSIYVYSTCDGNYDLPLLLDIAQANRHDGPFSVFCLSRLRQLLPDFIFARAIYDSAHDAYAIYKLHHFWHIAPIIDLNLGNTGNRKYPDKIIISENGVPICPAGHKMVNWGYEPNDRNRIKWRCPKACRKDVKCEIDCSNSAYGRTFYTKPTDDYRLFTNPVRGSKAWKDLYNKRSSAERVNKRLTVDYKTEQTRCRSKKGVFARITLAGINVHLDAQIKDKQFSFFSYATVIMNQVA